MLELSTTPNDDMNVPQAYLGRGVLMFVLGGRKILAETDVHMTHDCDLSSVRKLHGAVAYCPVSQGILESESRKCLLARLAHEQPGRHPGRQGSPCRATQVAETRLLERFLVADTGRRRKDRAISCFPLAELVLEPRGMRADRRTSPLSVRRIEF